MAADQETEPRAQGMPKMMALKEDAYYSNCTVLESTPFDISVLFGKVRPRTDEEGRSSLVEVYERQVYLSHLQARALYDALGRTLSNLAQRQQQAADASTPPPETRQ
jgi:hypothetical protein